MAHIKLHEEYRHHLLTPTSKNQLRRQKTQKHADQHQRYRNAMPMMGSSNKSAYNLVSRTPNLSTQTKNKYGQIVNIYSNELAGMIVLPTVSLHQINF